VPGAELPARIRAVVPDPSTPVVIHCAGRTRGIVAARMLIDAGCPNPVTVLENGVRRSTSTIRIPRACRATSTGSSS
jgi:rhodanese-related sulfurtransferase